MMLHLPPGARVEFWIETDVEIDEDVEIESTNVPPPEVSLLQESPEEAEVNMIEKWIITLLSVFQTRFFLTNRALNWLLRFLSVLLGFLGRYSPRIAELAIKLPKGIHQYEASLLKIIQGGTFE